MESLYKYLENLWEEKYTGTYTKDEFMNEWIRSNFANTTLYEEFFAEECLGYHCRHFNINHFEKTIEFVIEQL